MSLRDSGLVGMLVGMTSPKVDEKAAMYTYIRT
jgi:hypothetical protein